MTQRNVLFWAFAVASVMTFVGCPTTHTPAVQRDVADDSRAINTLLDQFTAAFDSGDAAAVADAHTDDAMLFFPNQEAVEGKAAIQAVYERMLQTNADGATRTVVFTPLETQVAGDWAYERGNGTVTITAKPDKPTVESFRYLDIYRRQADGSWKIHRDMVNSSTPQPSAAGQKK